MAKKPNLSFQTSLFTFIKIIIVTLAIFPHDSLQDNYSPYFCPYPCFPPPIGGSLNPPVTPTVPRPSPPAITSNCPPPPSPPASPVYYYSPPPPSLPAPYYYYSPPPPPSSPGQYYYYSPPPPTGGYNYYPPSGGYYPYGNAPPPPNPIMPYFPFYFKSPPGSPHTSTSTRIMSMNVMNPFQLQGCLCSVMLILSFVLVWR